MRKKQGKNFSDIFASVSTTSGLGIVKGVFVVVVVVAAAAEKHDFVRVCLRPEPFIWSIEQMPQSKNV